MRCVPNISREYETFGQRSWCCKNIEEVQKTGAIAQVLMAFLFFSYDSLWYFVHFLNFFPLNSWWQTSTGDPLLTFTISMSGLTPPSAVVMRNIWHGWRRLMRMSASASVVLAVVVKADGTYHHAQWISLSCYLLSVYLWSLVHVLDDCILCNINVCVGIS